MNLPDEANETVFSDAPSRLRFTLEETNDDNPLAPSLSTNSKKDLATKDAPLLFESHEEETNGNLRPKKRKKEPQPYILLFSILVSTLWIISAILFLSNNNMSGQTPMQALSMLVTLLGPAAFFVLSGLLAETMVKSNRGARALASAANRLLEPQKITSNAAKSGLQSVRGEIDRLEEALVMVTSRLGDLENTIEIRAASLRKASEDAHGGADRLVSTMETEQTRLTSLLDALSDLTKTAQQTTRAATEGFEEKAAKLTIAADNLAQKSDAATQNAEIAAQKLDDAVIKTVGAISGLDAASVRGEQALARAHDLMVLARVRADDAVSGVSVAIESLKDAAEDAALTAQNVSSLVNTQAENTRSIGISTIDDVRAIAEQSAEQVILALRAEAEQARIIAAQSLESLNETSQTINQLSKDASDALAKQLGDNNMRLEIMRQHSFEINQDADNFAQTKLKEAQNLVNNSSNILAEAGDRIQERFSSVVNACADQARSIEDVIDGLNRKLAELPNEATARANAVEAALEQTLSRLNDAGRKAVDDAQILDQSFQSRLRDSYSALGEIVQRLGAFSGTFSAPSFPNFPTTATPATNIDQSPPKYDAPISISKSPINQAQSIPNSDGAPLGEVKPVPPRFSSVLSPARPVQSVASHVEAPKLRGRVSSTDSSGFISNPNENIMPEPQKFEINAPVETLHVVTAQEAPISAPPVATGPIAPPVTIAPEPEPVPEQVPAPKHIETKQKTAASEKPKFATQRIENPFEDTNFIRPSLGASQNSDWNWRDVLSKIDSNKATRSTDIGLNLISELDLNKILPDFVLERLSQSYMRDEAKGRAQTRLALPAQVKLLKSKMAKDTAVQDYLTNFISERRENASKGLISGNELRLYLIAESALD